MPIASRFPYGVHPLIWPLNPICWIFWLRDVGPIATRQRPGSHRWPVAVSALRTAAEPSCHRLALVACRRHRSDRMVAVIRGAASVHHAVVSQRSTRAHGPIDRGVDSDGLLSSDAGTR